MLVSTIKAALENVVLCRGANSAKESYEYAEKMESTIKSAMIARLQECLKRVEQDDSCTLENEVKALIHELKE
jgi:Mn-dependent DtxR family transcriptional regulator